MLLSTTNQPLHTLSDPSVFKKPMTKVWWQCLNLYAWIFETMFSWIKVSTCGRSLHCQGCQISQDSIHAVVIPLEGSLSLSHNLSRPLTLSLSLQQPDSCCLRWLIKQCVVVVDNNLTSSPALIHCVLVFPHCATLACCWSYFANGKVAYGSTKGLSCPKLPSPTL